MDRLSTPHPLLFTFYSDVDFQRACVVHPSCRAATLPAIDETALKVKGILRGLGGR
jgi:hypothetical protein